MSEAKEPQEPTMEEILASIRRIISEDGEPEGEGKGAAESPAEAEPNAEEQSEGDAPNVLELTEVVEDEAEVVEPEAEPEPTVDEEEVALDDDFEVEAEPAPAVHNNIEEGLVSPATASATTTAFTDMTSVMAATRGLALGQNQTLEGIVKELLRPMLKEWLDANLTLLVQRIVEREVVKLAGRAEDDDTIC